MKTLLDEFYSWFLQEVVYADRELRIIVAEGFRAAEPEEITIGGHVIKETYAINTSEASRLADVRFGRPIAWQLVDESFTSGDDYAVRESTFAPTTVGFQTWAVGRRNTIAFGPRMKSSTLWRARRPQLRPTKGR